ncbi:MAG: NapC/NirT family cytochrome c [Verrucomicrobia bacterium]|nr:NapC/NirT family cytochrome c [Verrucomicrobiota bacterium]
MNDPAPAPSATPAPHSSLFRNWTSLIGLAIMVTSLFSFFLLFLLDALAHSSNPYVGVLTFLVAPTFLVFGLILTIIGLLLRRRKFIKESGIAPRLQIDLSRPRDRRTMVFFLGGTVVFLLMAAMGSYHTYHFTESTAFCGQTCHKVMEPELTAYHNGPHARVSCTDCHIGPGATWFVKSKLSGTYQVYAVLAKKYPRPIPTPISNLRPAQETCEQCHWPKKFVGNLDRTFNYFLSDPTNSTFAVRLLMKVGGGDPTHGPTGGIHWHMNVDNKIQYIATDEARQKIPWVRMISSQGVVTEFRTPKYTNEVDPKLVRTMDCMDCHNRPAHVYQAPNTAVNLAMNLNHIDPSIPFIKSNAVYVLTQTYQDEIEARQKIATTLANSAPQHPRIKQAIDAVQQIYKENFFPHMKVNWKTYPDNIGHMVWPGCFRCHDGLHKTADKKQSIKASDCNACHILLAQGTGKELQKLSAEGVKFDHPGGELDANPACNDCHNGGL